MMRSAGISAVVAVAIVCCGFAAEGAADASIKTGVTIHYKRSRGLYGFVFSPRPRCTGRAIHVFKQKGKVPDRDRDKNFGTVFAYKKHGKYKWHGTHQRVTKGDYYAMMRKSRDRDSRGCEADYSRTIHVEHPQLRR